MTSYQNSVYSGHVSSYWGVLTWEESDKRILHSTLQADLWVTKDTNKKGDNVKSVLQSSRWIIWLEAMQKDRRREKHRERVWWMKVTFWSIQQPNAHRAVQENHFSLLQGMYLAWACYNLPALCFAFPLKSLGMEGRDRRSLRLTRDGTTSSWSWRCL